MSKRIAFLTLLALIGLGIVMGWVPIPKLSMYPTEYQGPKPSFYAIDYNGTTYMPSRCYGASACEMSTYLDFDPDDSTLGIGNLEGEETSMFIPRSSVGFSAPSWVPREWLSDLQYFKNPVRVWIWRVDNKVYRMEEWVLKWFVSISYKWDSDAEAYTWDGWNAKGIRYHDAVIWFKIDLSSVNWYFKAEGSNATYPEKVVFTIAKLRVNKVWRYVKTKDDEANNDPNLVSKIRVIPMSSGSIMPIYTDFHGREAPVIDASQAVGKDVMLNPEIFRKVVYTKIILSNFGSQAYNYLGWGLGGLTLYGDVVTYEIDVHVFVIGDWVVQDIDNVNAKDYGRDGNYDIRNGPLNPVLDVLTNPWFLSIMSLLLVVVLVVILAIYAPGILYAVGEVARSAARRR